jgi:predicted transcriptional regulator
MHKGGYAMNYKEIVETTVKNIRQTSEWALFQWEKSMKEAMEQFEKFQEQFKK